MSHVQSLTGKSANFRWVENCLKAKASAIKSSSIILCPVNVLNLFQRKSVEGNFQRGKQKKDFPCVSDCHLTFTCNKLSPMQGLFLFLYLNLQYFWPHEGVCEPSFCDANKSKSNFVFSILLFIWPIIQENNKHAIKRRQNCNCRARKFVVDSQLTWQHDTIIQGTMLWM